MIYIAVQYKTETTVLQTGDVGKKNLHSIIMAFYQGRLYNWNKRYSNVSKF